MFKHFRICHTDVLMTLRTFITDDEPLAREMLARWVGQDPRLRLVGQAGNGEDTLKKLHSTPVDLLFLDIQMPGMDGLQTLKAIRAENLKTFVVFVTAWNQHAVRAFDLQAGDYLVKPVRKARFAEAVNRARQALEQRECIAASGQDMEPLLIREGDRMTPVGPGSIVWVEAASQYARIHTGDNQYLLSRPLAEVESLLSEQLFLRVHRSALVNLNCVRHIRRHNGNYRLELADGTEVPVARSRRKDVLQQLLHVNRTVQA